MLTPLSSRVTWLCMVGLTTRQKQVLAFIKASVKRRGFSPSRREILVRFGCSEEHLRALVRKGYIKIHPIVSRGIQVLK